MKNIRLYTNYNGSDKILIDMSNKYMVSIMEK